MIGVTANVDEASIRKLNGALAKLQEAGVKIAANAPKLIAANMCQSLRRRTNQAPKKARRREMAMSVSLNPPRYITYKNGKPLPVAIHRWSLTRLLGTHNQMTKDYFVYAHFRHTKAGKISKDLSAERRELIEQHGGIARAGLAKQTWNWIRARILNNGKERAYEPPPGKGKSQYTKRMRRDPKKAVKGVYKNVGSGKKSGAFAEIDNNLSYIADAMKPGAVEEASEKAVNKYVKKLELELATIADKISNGTATQADFDRATELNKVLREMGEH